MTLEAGAPRPRFTLPGIDGREYSLPRDAAGAPVLLVFFKTTCETCDLAFPYINRLREAYPEGWTLWTVAQDPPEAAQAYAEKRGITAPVLIDAPDYHVSGLYDPEATPTLVLLGPDGRVTYRTHGFAKDDLNELARLIAAYTGAAPAVVAPAGDGQPAFRPG